MLVSPNLYPIQSMVVSQLYRHKKLLLMLPRQEGKTEVGIRIIRDILDTRHTRQSMFLAKSRKAAKKATREKFSRIFEKDLWKVNTEQIISKNNPNAICFIESVDKDPDRIRGGTYHFIHWSEVAFSQLEHGVTVHDVVQKILLPTFRKTDGFALLESTPNGENGWKELWDICGDFGARTLRVSLSMLREMGLISEYDYDKIKKDTLPLIFRQEFECEFVSFTGLIYEEFADHMIENFDLPDMLDMVAIGIDWGYVDASCMLAAYRYQGRIYVFDEIYASKMLLEEFAEKILSHIRLWDARGVAAVADHEPDRIGELQRRGIPCGNADKANIVGNRIEIKELFWKDEIRIHPRCKNLIRDIKSISWCEDIKTKREDADYDRCTWGHYDAEAAFRYLIRNLSKITETEDVNLDFTDGRKA